MRFHWLEIVIYNGVLYIPMLLLGFDWRVLLGMAVFSTIMGHFNHSNLKINVGPLRYLLNHPGMHIWHHDFELHYRAGCNFGINLSLWDWIFKTAYLPEGHGQPEKLGFPGIKRFPKDFISQQLFPLSTALSKEATR
jgi:sterol desaturase/sphingolipid hydroxylase (fatty acid hydroxylase superfamily)